MKAAGDSNRYAGLNPREGKHCGNRLGKALEPIDHRDQNISHNPVFDLGG
jgi:hypothetical protein